MSSSRDATSGPDTHAKKNMYKRSAKADRTPPKLKKIKVSQDTIGIYDKFIGHGQKFKSVVVSSRQMTWGGLNRVVEA